MAQARLPICGQACLPVRLWEGIKNLQTTARNACATFRVILCNYCVRAP